MSNFHMYVKQGFVSKASDMMKQKKGNNENAGGKSDIGLLRHMVLNSIRAHSLKYKEEYGKVVICCDSKKYWRKEYFPFYKASRKKNRDASDLNWEILFKYFDEIKQELKDHSLYKVIEVEGAEADDIIASLCWWNQKDYNFYGLGPTSMERIMIVSADQDFLQLQKYSFVDQFDPMHKRNLRTDKPDKVLLEHIITGDRGDGIPNIFSPDNCFVLGVRQKPIREEKLRKWINSGDTKEFITSDEILRGYKRNEKLIDLDQIPEDLKKAISTAYEDAKTQTRSQFLNYLIVKQCSELIGSIGDF